MRTRSLLWKNRIFPLWAEDKRRFILLCALLGLAGGLGSAALLHNHNQLGLYVLPLGIAGVLGYGIVQLQELYHKYLACGWDMYF